MRKTSCSSLKDSFKIQFKKTLINNLPKYHLNSPIQPSTHKSNKTNKPKSNKINKPKSNKINKLKFVLRDSKLRAN